MQTLCFKPRSNCRSVQLIRHCYNPERQRSQTGLDTGGDPWKTLLPHYLKNHHAWQAVLQSAQEAGIAKIRKSTEEDMPGQDTADKT